MTRQRVVFSGGTLILQGEFPAQILKMCVFDPRTQEFKAPGCDYAKIMLCARNMKLEVEDFAADFGPVELKIHHNFILREHQNQAYQAWKRANFRGIAALPTGSGKSFLAVSAVWKLQRPALILVPTIDLLLQWHRQLEVFFQRKIGIIGGGEKQLEDITVCTYDSAVIQMEFIGNRFALLICDECHHLSGGVYRNAAKMCIAPYRLGLSATPGDAESEQMKVLSSLLGEVILDVQIGDLEGKVLAPYEVESIFVELTELELQRYLHFRKIFTDFARRSRIDFGKENSWRDFLIAVSRRPDGQEAFAAYLQQREISRQGEMKLEAVWEIFRRHRSERILVFTADNAMAYKIGEMFRLPVITHHTKLSERKEMLEAFRSGEYPILVTSKVLNEGVDVPEASVGIVVSGSGSVREHVQRLGRILRSAPGKRAVMYEIINADTAEIYTSKRRRLHSAYAEKELI